MAEEQPIDSGNEMYADLGVKLRDIEEKQNIIKDRVLLIGENLVSQKSEVEEEVMEIKSRLFNIEEEIRRLKLTMNSIAENTNNFARKTELDIMKKQFSMFQPLELARLKDVENMIQKALKNLEAKKQQN